MAKVRHDVKKYDMVSQKVRHDAKCMEESTSWRQMRLKVLFVKYAKTYIIIYLYKIAIINHGMQ